jgi:hypothetical protein
VSFGRTGDHGGNRNVNDVRTKAALVGQTRYASTAEAVSLGAPLLACSPDGGAREVSRLAIEPSTDRSTPLSRPSNSYVVHHEPENEGPTLPPSWTDVEKVLDRLARAGATIPITPTSATTIGGYERGRRVLLQSSNGPLWLAVDSIHECWRRFEELGRIRRSDMLDPGRCSGFMMALFRQVPGVTEKRVRATAYLMRGDS